ncbi:MAG: hypothetical protein E6X17_15715 [Sporomusaceae bacterium]|nr:hypothetical protein [Sporomusaceae bacterium]
MEDRVPSRRPSWLDPRLPWKLLLILAMLLLFAIGNFVNALSLLQTGPAAVAGFYFASVVLYLLPVYGLYRLKGWARLLQMFLSLSNVISGGAAMLRGQLFDGMFNIVIYGLIAIYLLSDEARGLFKKAA